MGRRARGAERNSARSVAFAVTQWMKFQRQTLIHQKTIADNIYYRNVNNNAGVFDTLIGGAEEQESKESVPRLLFPAGAKRHQHARRP